MSNLLELTASIVSSHVSNTQMTSDDMLQELQRVYDALKVIEAGDVPSADRQPELTIKQAFKKDEVICMVCGKGFKTLKRHLNQAHDLKPGQYRKRFDIPPTLSLTARSYSDSRRESALQRGLGDNLAKARAIKTTGTKAAVPAKRIKAAVPAIKVTAPVPAVTAKAPVPMKTAKAPVPMVRAKTPVAVKEKAPLSAKKAAAPKARKGQATTKP